MNEYDSPNYAEYVYDRKNEGNFKKIKTLAILGYVLVSAAAFIALATTLVWLIAVLPIFIWMMVYFTWGFISFDYYYEFNHGEMEFGKVHSGKGGRRRRPVLKIRVKEAKRAEAYKDGANLSGAYKLYDFSESQSSDKRIIIFFEENGKEAAVIFEATAKVARLIASYCKGAASLKEKSFHG